MPSKFNPLNRIRLLENNRYSHPPQLPEIVHYEDKALCLLTDFTKNQAFHVRSDVSIEIAKVEMRTCHVHLLLVVNEGSQVLGLITSEDLMGEKPIQMAKERKIHHEEVLVRMIMTPIDQILAIDIDELKHARVGDVIETLNLMRAHYALVIEVLPDQGMHIIRGMFAASQISRQLDKNIINELGAARSLMELSKQIR